MTEEADWKAPSGTVVLDIGDDVGALVVYCPTSWLATEIEVDREEFPGTRTHTGVRERSAGTRPIAAAVFPGLTAGRYQVFDPSGRPVVVAEVIGGEVTEVDLVASGAFDHDHRPDVGQHSHTA